MKMLPTTQTQTEKHKMTHTVKVGDKVVYNNTDYEPDVMKGSVGIVDDFSGDDDIMIDFGNSHVLYAYSHEYTPYAEPLKLEVGKTYVLNNGEKHVCEVGSDTGFAMGIYWYNEDGRCGTYDADEHLSVSHEYTPYVEGKTLAELDVKAGDVVEMITNPRPELCGAILTIDSRGYAVNDDIDAMTPEYDMKYGRTYRIISRATPQPTLWRDMTDAEKGALLLAKHEGKAIEWFSAQEWVTCKGGLWRPDTAYRIKPTPKVETVTMYANKTLKGFGLVRGPKTTHKITFTTTDGKPDTASIKMEEL